MRSFLTTILVLSGTVGAFAQWDTAVVNTSSFKVGVDSRGSLFHQGPEMRSEFPLNSGKHMIRYGGLWLLGESGGTIYGAMNTGYQNSEFWPGPLDTITGLPTTDSFWNRVWNVSATQVSQHRSKFDMSGYEPTVDIKDWPAKHTTPNVQTILAPFIDWDLNGEYNPSGGDYPQIIGTSNAYFIDNEGSGEHSSSGAPSLGVEVQGMVYTSNVSDLSNVVFVRYNVINRSGRDYTSFDVGFYVDYALGNSGDNRIGTDVSNQYMYAYNGDDFDEGDEGYGTELPSAWVLFPKLDLDGTVAFIRGDSIRDLPQTAEELRNIMNGKWSGGETRSYGDKGINGNSPTPFIYSGASDPNFQSGNWSDSVSGDPVGDRSGLIIHHFDKLDDGDFVTVDVAIGVGLQSELNESERLSSVWKMRNGFNLLSIKEHQLSGLDVGIYPNPVSGNQFTVETNSEDIISIQMLDATGREVLHYQPSQKNLKKITIPCSEHVADGVYYMNVKTKSTKTTHKVLIHRR